MSYSVAGRREVAAARPPGRARGLDGLPPAALTQAAVEVAHPLEDLDRGGLGLLVGGRLDPVEADGVVVLDGDLGELEPPPVAQARATGDRRGHHRSSGLERQPADARARLAQLAGARASPSAYITTTPPRSSTA
ncbi:MAG: hypothetical protein WKF31_05695 [Thermoleophilaceae bacterium]